MPKIYYISDLHLEFEDKYLLEIYVDKEYKDSYLILAGDICSYTSKSKFIKFFEMKNHKIYLNS
jgi:predicted phosphodiesterase